MSPDLGGCLCWGCMLTLETETLFKNLPDMKIAVPIEELETTPLEKDVGINKLPVTF